MTEDKNSETTAKVLSDDDLDKVAGDYIQRFDYSKIKKERLESGPESQTE